MVLQSLFDNPYFFITANGNGNHVADKREDGEPPAKKPCTTENEA